MQRLFRFDLTFEIWLISYYLIGQLSFIPMFHQNVFDLHIIDAIESWHHLKQWFLRGVLRHTSVPLD